VHNNYKIHKEMTVWRLWNAVCWLPFLTVTAHSPVIGVLSQPDDSDHTDFFYIAGSYAKWLEVGGARSIPIPYDASTELFDEIFQEIDGLLLPGGTSDFPPILQYALDTIVESNRQGHYFPVWGTCLGYEFLIQYAGGTLDTDYDAQNISLSLEHIQRQELYADKTIYETVRDYPVTMNNHHQGISPLAFRHTRTLSQRWNITSINYDRNRRPFVSTIEPIEPERFPWYGVQFHPEKNAFEYATYPGTDIPYEAIDHSDLGVVFSIHMARFFVNLARRQTSGHVFTGKFPYVQEYPSTTGLKFELKYLIPHSQPKTTTPRASYDENSR
jgi:gamma-glutamyl hydrolase